MGAKRPAPKGAGFFVSETAEHLPALANEIEKHFEPDQRGQGRE